ncbi:hypothetical protein [Roseomonas fluvialis]|uniref:Uncharacterized protein n=1 Tax=Roseomonas fluvialis TaxID=1750527 RepID=A0ABN6P1G4_9PROT|nr:hypothetical protein [Roseomonas fluvialis]BDG72457.1 hypothetical protein Rmf_23860 [Roseomonas fluvialis]
MVALVQFAFILTLAAAPALLAAACVRRVVPLRARRGGDPVAFQRHRRAG